MLQSLCVYEVHVNAAHNLKSLGSSLLLLGLTWSCIRVSSAPVAALHISEASSASGSKPSGQGSFSSSSRSWAVWRYTGGNKRYNNYKPGYSNITSFEGETEFKTKPKALGLQIFIKHLPYVSYCKEQWTKWAKTSNLKITDVAEKPWVAWAQLLPRPPTPVTETALLMIYKISFTYGRYSFKLKRVTSWFIIHPVSG